MNKHDEDDFNLKRSLHISTRLLLLGLLLLCIVFFVPHAGYQDLKAIFATAKASGWQNLFDWPSAWCSLKIILLSAGGFLITIAIEELLIASKRNNLAIGFLFLVAIPILGCLVGLYYLVKAIL